MRLVACGGRVGAEPRVTALVLGTLNRVFGGFTLGHGAAPGYDRLAQAWAESMQLPTQPIPVDNQLDGDDLGAPKRRNWRLLRWLLEYSDHRVVVGFPGGPGTRHMLEIAHAAGVEVIDVEVELRRFKATRWPRQGETRGVELFGGAW